MSATHFVYGTLRPDELAYRQIRDLVQRTEPATLHNWRLYVRDGLPLIAAEPGHHVQGDLLFAVPGAEDILSKRIADYEDEHLYVAETVRVAGQREEIGARVRVGRSPGKGNATPLDASWTSKTDPLLSEGLQTVRRQAEHHFQRSDIAPWPRPADMRGFWDIFVPLQGLYLVLCTILERYTALIYGPACEPGRRVAKLRMEPDIDAVLGQVNPPVLQVVDSRDPGARYQVPGRKAFDAWYQVRSNLSHRGKAGFADVGLVERSLVGLHDSLQALLDLQLQRVPSADWLRPIYDATRPDA